MAIKFADSQVYTSAIKSIRDLLASLDEDVSDGTDLAETPRRFFSAFEEMTAGYHKDPDEILSKIFETKNDEMVIVRQIEFTSLCRHHLLPFFGTADIAYIPDGGRIVGLSKIPRVVQVFAQRIQTQETMTQQIANAIMNHKDLKPKGVGITVRAVHSCLRHRGARQPSAEMITNCMLGSFLTNDNTRAEFLSCVR